MKMKKIWIIQKLLKVGTEGETNINYKQDCILTDEEEELVLSVEAFLSLIGINKKKQIWNSTKKQKTLQPKLLIM